MRRQIVLQLRQIFRIVGPVVRQQPLRQHLRAGLLSKACRQHQRVLPGLLRRGNDQPGLVFHCLQIHRIDQQAAQLLECLGQGRLHHGGEYLRQPHQKHIVVLQRDTRERRGLIGQKAPDAGDGGVVGSQRLEHLVLPFRGHAQKAPGQVAFLHIRYPLFEGVMTGAEALYTTALCPPGPRA